ncbi:acyl-CoA dehydrogenase family protein [Shewanella gelidii]|uniref:3-methylmercaptopropionyl-CoA dehydrogenase n=1 Tax=Shewanella gelidii TaxID=1642821 RepID=A0A917JZN8_9GAMM|nr:acyl-CoA dehydrogenase family protein [Shewanella gelidii]MCL1098127.1 acyl-CoA dehydrogenase C-terminal domain-containing protein [Shewanella gelidii]GGI90726.1 acyl-CoA dehydrogenase [Shewanella gelidii]
MNPYTAPLTEMRFLLEHVFDASNTWSKYPAIAEAVDIDTAAAILDEADKVSRELIHPLNREGDEQGVQFIDGKVITPDGYRDVYAQYVEGGWVGLCGESNFGGMGMPKMLGVLVDEMSYSGCNAFTLYGSLTAGAALCIHAHASESLKDKFLPKLYSGEWAGAMDMTEPQAGSDLRNIRTKAVPQADGSHHITGSKIFITGGDHDLTENVIHLVLAKLPDTDGISLFLVPKYKVSDCGELAGSNGVTVGSIEHKMGLKGSSTCVMNYDNAQGFLVGRANRGLVCMFTMMNYERLAIGIQGLGSSQAAYQMAAEYAKERIQGKAAQGGSGNKQGDPIIVHGDVRRMLLNIRTLTDAGRALAVFTGKQLDVAKHATGEEQKKADRLVGLLTPVAKAFLTDRGLEATITAQQVFGGHGYIRETGIEQLVRDTRIAQIYEGTNGIQAIDFLGRKLIGDDLFALKELVTDIQQELDDMSHVESQYKNQLFGLINKFVEVIAEIKDKRHQQSALINACAVDSLDAFGYILYGYFWLKMTESAAVNMDKEFARAKQQLTHFYFEKLLTKANYHLSLLRTGDQSVMAIDESLF